MLASFGLRCVTRGAHGWRCGAFTTEMLLQTSWIAVVYGDGYGNDFVKVANHRI